MTVWNILHSLRARILFTVFFVLTLTAFISAVLASASIKQRFDSYLADVAARDSARIEQMQTNVGNLLATTYRRDGFWSRSLVTSLDEISQATGYPMVLMDMRKFPVASTMENSDLLLLREMMYETAAPVMVEEETIGYLYLHEPAPPVEQGSGSDLAFIVAVNHALTLATLITGTLAFVLIVVMMHPILKTVEAMTDVANRMANGDLGQRVPVRSKGEIGQLAQSFNRMNEHLSRNEQLRRGMVSDIAHELRSPLSNVRAYMEAMRDGVIKPNPALFSSLHEQVLTLQRVVEDLQELALADAGGLKLNLQCVDLKSTVEQVIAITQPLNSTVTVHTEIPYHLPPIYADTGRLWQILQNLVKNALLYTPPDGYICISAHTDNGYVSLIIKDTGEGIPPEHIGNIFERFYRVDRSRARATGGAGLGLALVKELVDAHGGTISVESIMDIGTTMKVRLPIYDAVRVN